MKTEFFNALYDPKLDFYDCSDSANLKAFESFKLISLTVILQRDYEKYKLAKKFILIVFG